MTEAEAAGQVRRILVALDASMEGLACLDLAAVIAASLQSRLEALFVEEEELLDLAALPFARTVAARAGAPAMPFGLAAITAELRRQAALARRAVERAAAERHVAWEFAVVRGRFEAVLSGAAPGDILVVARAAGAMLESGRVGRAAQYTARSAQAGVLLVGDGRIGSGPVAVLYDGSPEAARSLATAVDIARELACDLLVGLAPGPGRPAPRLRAAAGAAVGDLPARYRVVTAADPGLRLRHVLEWNPGLLVLDAKGLGLPDDVLADMVLMAAAPVLLLR